MDYFLVVKFKMIWFFCDFLVGFFKLLLMVLYEIDMFYKDIVLMENIVRWVVFMFLFMFWFFRYMVIIVVFVMEVGLVEIVKKLDDCVSKMM